MVVVEAGSAVGYDTDTDTHTHKDTNPRSSTRAWTRWGVYHSFFFLL